MPLTSSTTPPPSADAARAAATSPELQPEALLAAASRLRDEVARRIVGQREVLDEILMAILAGGHALLVGVPGLAKTLMIKSVADAMRLDFRRIQFTPDLVPSDITGTEILEENTSTGGRSFRFVKGPVFANIVLADEINRAPPRTQAALLEAMQEHRVTAAGETMRLPRRPAHRAGTGVRPRSPTARPVRQRRDRSSGRVPCR